MPEVSLFEHGKNATPIGTQSLWNVLRRIRTGAYAEQIARVRAVKRTQSEERYRTAKVQLPAFTPCGVFSYRASDRLIQTNGLAQYDIDSAGDVRIDAVTLKSLLADDPHITYAFISPSGEGVKCALPVSIAIPSAEVYKHAWAEGLRYLSERYPDIAVANDKSCSDVSRLCFVSHDPALYGNPQAQPLSIPPYIPREQPRKAYKPFAPTSTDEERRRVEEALRHFSPADYNDWLLVSQCLHASGEPWAMSIWDAWSQSGGHYVEQENHRKWDGFRTDGTRRTLGTLFKEAMQRGYQPARRQQAVARTIQRTIPRTIARTIRRSL